MIAGPAGPARVRMFGVVALDGRPTCLFVAYLDPNAAFFQELTGVGRVVGADVGHYDRSQAEADDRARAYLAPSGTARAESAIRLGPSDSL